jgi:hypothetical protein
MPARTRTGRTGIVIAANFPAGELLATHRKTATRTVIVLSSHQAIRLLISPCKSPTTKKL